MIFLSIVFLIAFLLGNGKIASLLLLNLQSSMPLIDFHWESKNTIILLGSGLVRWSGDQMSSTLLGYSRIHEAARLYGDCKKTSKDCMVLASGGYPKKSVISEAEVMQKELMELGIPEENIILESKSNNTYENAKFSSAILHAQRRGACILVTSGVHMKRSLLYFSHFGIRATEAPSDRLEVFSSWFALSYHFFLTDLALHERMGILQFYAYQFMK